MFRISPGKKIRKRLLQLLNKSNKETNSLTWLKKISSNPKEQLSATEYLKNNTFVNYTPYARLFESKITIEDIYDVDSNNESIKLDQSKITCSIEKVTNSSDSSIKDSFNDLYKTINDSEYENRDEIKEKVQELENELQKEEINKTEIQHIMEWLKENAEEIRNIAINIVAAALTGI